ncbi:hypothetical protein BMF94_1113 [Rhodotorula taiwanensis]|uniref:Uncharacterized protein n=1 Tax=Rhodotorula taiwanensis TaxID=741276 RepID=A0A2S5BGA6_9BASI|nr:hypothetical protein BMF94_1113 [Rhodotorula taiwanensis]
MSVPAHHLDYAQSTYFVLSTSSSAPPPLPSSNSTSALSYIGPVGDGLMANEHIIALQNVPTGAADRSADVDRAKKELKGTAGVEHVEVMQAKQRRQVDRRSGSRVTL